MRRFSFAFACVVLSIFFIAPSQGLAQMKQASSEWSFAICLKEVHFEDNRNGNFSVYTDLPGYSAYEAPHFVKEYPNGCIPNADGNIVAKKPVAYESGKRPRVKAIFLTDCPQELYFKAVGPEINGQDFELSWKSVTADNGVVDLEFKRASLPFENDKVQYFENFTLHWQYSLDNSNWVDIDSSTNPLYVTYDWPNLDTVHHTLLNIGCKSANGGSDEATIVDDLYNIGFDRDAGVYRADGAGPIGYWTG